MIITSFCENFLKTYVDDIWNTTENPLKIDKRIIPWLLSGKKNINFKTATDLTTRFNEYLGDSKNIEAYFHVKKLISEEKDRGIEVEFPEKSSGSESERDSEKNFWTEIIHYVLTGKFQGFGRIGVLVFLLIFSIVLLVYIWWFL